MPSKSSTPITIRLRNDLWKSINEAASGLGMPRNEWISRRLASAFSDAHGVPKENQIVPNANDEQGESAGATSDGAW